MSGRDKKNQFLGVMYVLAQDLRVILNSLQYTDQENIGIIVVQKTLEFADCFEGDQFYETLTGHLIMEYFQELTKEEIEILKEELQRPNNIIQYFRTRFGKDGISEYLDNCYFMSDADFTMLSPIFVEHLVLYLSMNTDLTEMEYARTLVEVEETITAIQGEEIAKSVTTDCINRLAENEEVKKRLGYVKRLEK